MLLNDEKAEPNAAMLEAAEHWHAAKLVLTAL
jgi:hypothetical protein